MSEPFATDEQILVAGRTARERHTKQRAVELIRAKRTDREVAEAVGLSCYQVHRLRRKFVESREIRRFLDTID